MATPLIGDVLLLTRELLPDAPLGTLDVPAAPVLTAAVNAAGTIPTGTTIYAKLSALNQWGETLGSSEQSVAVTSPNNAVSVTGVLPVGATKLRVYYGTASGLQNQFIETTTGAATIVGLTAGTAGRVPEKNRAWLPDSDGEIVGAFTLYRWINEALKVASRIAGGLPDTMGVQTSEDNEHYVIGLDWVSIQHVWYDGYYCNPVNRSYLYRHNEVQGISFYWSTAQVNQNQVIRMWPFPNRSGSTLALSAGIGATDETIPLTTAPTDVVFPSMVQIDDEIISVTTSGTPATATSLLGAVRGWAGTEAVAHLSGAAVKELNLVVSGFRQPRTFTSGDAGKSLVLGLGWETTLADYAVHRFRSLEQAKDEADRYYSSFVDKVKELTQRARDYRSPVELGPPGRGFTLYPGSPFGMIKQ